MLDIEQDLLGVFRYFLLFLQYKIRVMRRVATYIPIPFMEISERLHNIQLRFHVVMCNGNEVMRSAEFSSAWVALSKVRERIKSDVFISSVFVYLPSGRLLCEVDGFGR